MATLPVDTSRLRPTEGQLALARHIAEGQARETRGVTHVPASAYTDPVWWAREKAALFGRLPQVLARLDLLVAPMKNGPGDAPGPS